MNGDAGQAVEVRLQIADDVDAADCPAQSSFVSWVAAVFDEVKYDAAAAGSLVVRIVTGQESAALNRDFRGKDTPTNVLAFPAGPILIPEPAEGDKELGDLVMCWEVVVRESRQQSKVLTDHLAHLTVHGTLHLLGHDHQTDAEAERMEDLERLIMQELGLPDPYRECSTRGD